MTIEGLQIVVTESGKLAESLMDMPGEATVRLGCGPTAEWMQVKMLAEIALQLRVMNDGNGAKQPGE